MLTVVSLFDGLGGARLALASLGLRVRYYRSEIDPAASAVHRYRFPDSVDLGDVRIVGAGTAPARPDLLVGGSPCQDLSSGRTLGKEGRAGLEGKKSSLFWEYVRIWRELKPKHFVFENVGSMRAADKAIISETFGVEPVLLDAALWTAQSRKRWFWTNIPLLPLPVGKGPVLWEELDDSPASELRLSPKAVAYLHRPSGKVVKRTPWERHGIDACNLDKSRTLVANLWKGVPYNAVLDCSDDKPYYRRLAVHEVERLFGVPFNYTNVPGVPVRERYRMLGNGFAVPVVAHLLKPLAG